MQTLSTDAPKSLISPSLSHVIPVLIDQATGRSFTSAPPSMQMAPRTSEKRAASAKRTHHPANSAVKRIAAPRTQALRTMMRKTYKDRIDSGCAAGSLPDKGCRGPCRGPCRGHPTISMVFDTLSCDAKHIAANIGWFWPRRQ